MPETTELNQQQYNDTETEIDLMGLLFKLLDKWYIIALSAIICAGIAGVYSWFIATPMYEATTRIYVTNNNETLFNVSDFQIGNYLTNDYKEVFSVWEVHDKVRQNLNLPYTVEELSKMLSVSNPSETRILNLTVKSSDPVEAAEIANEYAQVAKEYIAQTMATEGPNIMSVANPPLKPVSPQKTRNLIIGFLIGAVISGGIITLLFVLDDKLRTSEDVQRYGGLPTLAVIPITQAFSESTGEEAKQSKSAKKRGKTA